MRYASLLAILSVYGLLTNCTPKTPEVKPQVCLLTSYRFPTIDKNPIILYYKYDAGGKLTKVTTNDSTSYSLNYTGNQAKINFTSANGVTDNNIVSTLTFDDNGSIIKVSYKDAAGAKQSVTLQYNSSGHLKNKSYSESQLNFTYDYLDGTDNPTSYTVASYSGGNVSVLGVITNEYHLDKLNTLPFNFPIFDLIEPTGVVSPVHYGIQVGDLLPRMNGKPSANLIKRRKTSAKAYGDIISEYNYKYDSDGKITAIRMDEMYSSNVFSRGISFGYTCQ